MQKYLRQTARALYYNNMLRFIRYLVSSKLVVKTSSLQYAIEQFFLLFAMHSSIFIYNENIFSGLCITERTAGFCTQPYKGKLPLCGVRLAQLNGKFLDVQYKNREVLGNG